LPKWIGRGILAARYLTAVGIDLISASGTPRPTLTRIPARVTARACMSLFGGKCCGRNNF